MLDVYRLIFFCVACLVFRETNCRLAFFPRLCHFVFFFFSYAFSRTFECEWFPQICYEYKFQFKIRQTFIFCKLVYFQGDIFVVRFAFLFSRLRQFLLATTSAISLYALVQFHAKYPLIDSQSERDSKNKRLRDKSFGKSPR